MKWDSRSDWRRVIQRSKGRSREKMKWDSRSGPRKVKRRSKEGQQKVI